MEKQQQKQSLALDDSQPQSLFISGAYRNQTLSVDVYEKNRESRIDGK